MSDVGQGDQEANAESRTRACTGRSPLRVTDIAMVAVKLDA